MYATFEINRLIKYSPKHDAMFTKLKSELSSDTPGFRVLRMSNKMDCES